VVAALGAHAVVLLQAAYVEGGAAAVTLLPYVGRELALLGL
jgi:hypothetical protein